MPKILVEFAPIGEKDIQKAIAQIAKEQNKSVKEISQNIGKYQGRIKELTGQVSAASAAWKGSQQAVGTLQNLTSATERLATIQKQQTTLARESAKASLQSAKSRVSVVQQELNALKGKKASQQEIVAKTRELQKAQQALTKSSLGYERQVQSELKRAAASERNIVLDRQKAAAVQRQTALTQELTRIQSQQNKGAISAGQAAIQQSQAKIRAAQREITALKQQGASQNQIAKAAQRLTQEKGRLNQALARNAAAAQKSVAANTNLQNRFDKLGASVAVMTGNLASSAIVSGVNAARGAIGDSIGVYADYEQAIRDFESVGGDKDLGNIGVLKDKIKELGANTQKSAGEIASLTPSLRTAGLSADDAAASLKGLVNLSIVDKSGASIDELTEKSIDLGNAFGSIGDEEKFTKTLDTFVAAASKTNATFGGLANTVSKARGAISNANVDEASFAGIAAIFAEGGQRDEVAGTAINGMINDLNISLGVLTGAVEAPNRAIGRQVEVLEELGLTGERAAQLLSNGRWDETYLEIAALFQGIEDSSERSAKSQLAFGKMIGKTITASFGVARDKMDEIVEGARSADDNLGKAARKMSQTLKGSFKELGSVSEAIGLNLVEGIAPSLEKLTRLTTEALRAINGELSDADAGVFFENFNDNVDDLLTTLSDFADRVDGDFQRILEITGEWGGSIGSDVLPALQNLAIAGRDAIATLLALIADLFNFINTETPAIEFFGSTLAGTFDFIGDRIQSIINIVQMLVDGIKIAKQNLDNLRGGDVDIVGKAAEDLAELKREANQQLDVKIGADSEEIQKQIEDLKALRELTDEVDAVGGENRGSQKKLREDIQGRIDELRNAEKSIQKLGRLDGEAERTGKTDLTGLDEEAIEKQLERLEKLKAKALNTEAAGADNKRQKGRILGDIEKQIQEAQEALKNAPLKADVEAGDTTLEIAADTQPATEAIAEVPDTAPDPTVSVAADVTPATEAISAIPDAAAKAEAEAGQTVGNIAESKASQAQATAEDAAEKAQEAAKAARDAAIEAIEKQQIEGEIKIAQFKLDNLNAPTEAIALQEVEVTRKTLQKKLKLEEAGSKEALSIRKQLIDNEIKAQQALIDLANRRIDEEIAGQNRLLQARSQQSQTIINSQQRQAELMTIAEGAMARQNDLLAAQQGLQDALAAVESARLDQAVENAARGEDAIRQLTELKKAEEDRKNEGKEESESEKIKREEKERESAIKKEKAQREALEKELATLGLDRNATIEEAVLARQKAEDARAKQELENFARQQEAARQSLSLENQREASAVRRAALEARINESKAQQAAIEARIAENSARGELLKAEKQGDKEAIADAQLALSLAQQATAEAQKQIPLAASRTAEAQREIAAQQQRAALAEQALRQNQKAEAIARVNAEQNRQFDQNRERSELGTDLRDISVTVGLGQAGNPTQGLQQEIEQQPPVRIPAELELSDQQMIVNDVNLSAQNELVELLKQQIELMRERAVLEASETAEKLRAAKSEQQAIAESEGQGIAEKQARLEELNRPQLVGSFEEYEARKREKAALEEEIKQAEARKVEAEKEGDRLGTAIASTDEILEKSRERLEIARSQTSELEKQATLSERIAKATPTPTRIESGKLRGGLVSAGKNYPVVEDSRPEIYRTQSGQDYLLTAPQIFTPPKPGRIIPNEKAEAILRMQATLQRIGVPIRPTSVQMSPQTIDRVASQSGSGSEKEFALLRKEIAGLKGELKRPMKNTFHQRFELRSPDQSEVEKAARKANRESMEYLRDLLQ